MKINVSVFCWVFAVLLNRVASQGDFLHFDQFLVFKNALQNWVRDVLISLNSQLRLEIFLRQLGKRGNGLDDCLRARYRRNRLVC